jgi:hypothetical protein
MHEPNFSYWGSSFNACLERLPTSSDIQAYQKFRSNYNSEHYNSLDPLPHSRLFKQTNTECAAISR